MDTSHIPEYDLLGKSDKYNFMSFQVPKQEIEVMGSNPVQAWIFSGFNFTTAWVVCITLQWSIISSYNCTVQAITFLTQLRVLRSPPAKFERNHKTNEKTLKVSKRMSPLVKRSGLPLQKISFKEILCQRLISQELSEIFSSKILKHLA